MKTLTAVQEGPTNTLALNKDCTQVVVAGRNVFKVYEIREDSFFERANLRVGKNLNLNFSCNDVTWNQVEEQWLATAATNGAVVLWNLHRPARLKQETVFNDHKRTVNKVTFHGTEQNLLLSGSQDGTMKYFDIRMKEASVTFVSNAESVRDVQFNPHQCFSFAAVSENGTVQLWDLRRHDKCEKQFTAHSGPVFACDWHPEIKTWLATAGRDRNIKIWDLGFRPVLEYTVPTMASVGRIKWRPQRTYHIASCALVVDSSIHVWDVRRPYIPRASFNEHKDISTGIAWRGCPKTLLSTSKDCTLVQHVYQDAERPVRNANPVCVSFNSKGTVALAASLNKEKASKTKTPSTPNAKKGKEHLDTFVPIRCAVFEFDNRTPSPSEVFRNFAVNYVFSGKSLAEVCDHNSAVATDMGKHQIATTWGVLKLLFGHSSHEAAAVAAAPRPPVAALTSREEESTTADTVAKDNRPGTRHQSGNTGNSTADAVSVGGNVSLPSVERNEASGGVSDADSETEEHDSQERNLSHIASGLHFHSDFLFADSDVDGLGEFDFGGSAFLMNGDLSLVGYRMPEQDWMLPSEAFQPRREFKDRSPPHEGFNAETSFPESSCDSQTVEVENQTSALLCLPGTHEIISWNGSSIVVDVLNQLAEEGDVQTAVSIVLALGEKIRSLLDEAVLEHWFLSYIDLLHRFTLWNTAALVIRMSPVRSVQQMSQQSTTVHSNCRSCKKILLRSGWLCDSCRSVTNTCSICFLVVRGLYVWCQGCCHGGHIQHIMDWFSSNTACPMGCGHQCEY